MKKVSVAVVGASGYTGGELLKLLIEHPNVDLTCVTSREYAGHSVGAVFPRFTGTELRFSHPDMAQVASSAGVVFLCLPHGLASEFAVPLLDRGLKVFDLSSDFRLKCQSKYEQYYGSEHPQPRLLAEAVYGLPEKNRELIKSASLIACPGCYPTGIILPVYPLIKAQIASTKDIVICSMSGVTGAGRQANVPLLFAECNESIRSYSATGHRHIPEIEQELANCAGDGEAAINFIPHLIPVSRGIYSTIHLNTGAGDSSISEIEQTLQKFYGNEPFIRILPHGKLADTKNVIYTNICEISYDYNERTQKIILASAIDNLTKGASGQAIQCMNIVCGFEETAGLWKL
jgi:N-acetyl-gamma-glutamyl-phosphate reductase